MVVLVDDDSEPALAVRKFRHAPPVANEIRRASYSSPSVLNSIEDSEDEAGGGVWRNGSIRHPAVEAIRRPLSAMSDLRNRSQTRSPSLALSVNSFALT